MLRAEQGVPGRPFRDLRWRLLSAQGDLSQVAGEEPSQVSVCTVVRYTRGSWEGWTWV